MPVILREVAGFTPAMTLDPAGVDSATARRMTRVGNEPSVAVILREVAGSTLATVQAPGTGGFCDCAQNDSPPKKMAAHRAAIRLQASRSDARDQRSPMGLTMRGAAPENSWRGRPILYSGSAIISFSWAIQPTVRASAKMAVNRLTGMPIARCTMPE